MAKKHSMRMSVPNANAKRSRHESEVELSDAASSNDEDENVHDISIDESGSSAYYESDDVFEGNNANENEEFDEFSSSYESDEGDADEFPEMAKEKSKSKGRKKVRHPTLKPNTQGAFGSELGHLLSLPQTKSLPKPFPGAAGEDARTKHKEEKAHKVARESRAKYLARGHVDVISGWGPQPPIPFKYWGSKTAENTPNESSHWTAEERAIREGGAVKEKQLKRITQQGVVKLFNAITAAQGITEEVAQKAEARKLSSASAGSSAQKESQDGKALEKQRNLLGSQGKNQALANLSRSTFMDLVRGK